MASNQPSPETAATAANCRHVQRAWPLASELQRIIEGPAHLDYRIEKGLLPDAGQLEHFGFYKSIGLAWGHSHYRMDLPDGQEIHLIERDDHYVGHWDRMSLRRNPLAHLFVDAPGVALLGTAVIGAIAGRGR